MHQTKPTGLLSSNLLNGSYLGKFNRNVWGYLTPLKGCFVTGILTDKAREITFKILLVPKKAIIGNGGLFG